MWKCTGNGRPARWPMILTLPIDGIRCEGRAALSSEDVAAIGIFLTEDCQHAQLVAPDRVDRRLALLGPANMQRSRAAELDLAPFQFAISPWREAHADKPPSGIPQAPPAILGRLDQLLDLGRSEVFARAHLRIGQPTRRKALDDRHQCNCSFSGPVHGSEVATQLHSVSAPMRKKLISSRMVCIFEQ